jgi:hypothetical protein
MQTRTPTLTKVCTLPMLQWFLSSPIYVSQKQMYVPIIINDILLIESTYFAACLMVWVYLCVHDDEGMR